MCRPFTFYTTLECEKGGAVSKDKFSVSKDIKGLHIRFLPEQEQEQNISSREFLKQAEFINVESLTKKEEDENGGGSNGGSQSGGSQSGSQSGSQNQGGEQPATVTAPTISGTTPFTETTSVSISGPAGAEIRYTTDGSTPTAESALYSETFTLSDSATVKAIAIKDGVSSEVSTKSFTKGEGGGGSNGGGNDVN